MSIYTHGNVIYMILPDEIVTLIMHFARVISSHWEDDYIQDIKLMRNVTQYGVKRALVHLKVFKKLETHPFNPFLAGSGGRVFWGETYHLNI